MTAPTPAELRPATDFAELGVPAALVSALHAQGIAQPFPIQALTLPDALAGRDVLGKGMTGSGKTLAFSIPLVANLARTAPRHGKRVVRGLILVPTRELASQVLAVIDPLAKAVNMRCTTVFGGVSQFRQVEALRQGVDIVIACPGRLEDLLRQRATTLSNIEVTVLDEADHMADLGFLPVVKRLLDATPSNSQRLLFSATLDSGVDALVRRYIANPVTHALQSAETPAQLDHHVLAITSADKRAVVTELATHTPRLLLFTRTKHGAKKLAKQLVESGVKAHELHGNLSQAARDRNLAAFSAGRTGVLVATDVAARGIHVDDIDLVVHVDPPAEHKAYLHRSGRTARAGARGSVATLMTPDQTDDVRKLAKAAGIAPRTTSIKPGHPLIRQLGGRGEGDASEAPMSAFEYTTEPAETLVHTGERTHRARPAGGRSPRGRTSNANRGGASNSTRGGTPNANRSGTSNSNRGGASNSDRSGTSNSNRGAGARSGDSRSSSSGYGAGASSADRPRQRPDTPRPAGSTRRSRPTRSAR